MEDKEESPDSTPGDSIKRQSSGMSDLEKRILRNAEIIRTMPDNIGEALAKARRRPRWCSEIRWRMELKRRKYRNVRY